MRTPSRPDHPAYTPEDRMTDARQPHANAPAISRFFAVDHVEEPQSDPGRFRMLLGEQVVDLVQAGVFTPERVDRWWAAMDEAVNAGHFTGGGTAFIVSGTVR